MKTTPAIIGAIRQEPDVYVPPSRRGQAKPDCTDSLIPFGFVSAALVDALQLANPVSVGSGKGNNDKIKGCGRLWIG